MASTGTANVFAISTFWPSPMMKNLRPEGEFLDGDDAFVNFLPDGAEPHDRPGDQLRKHRDIEEHLDRVALGFEVAAIDIDEV